MRDIAEKPTDLVAFHLKLPRAVHERAMVLAQAGHIINVTVLYRAAAIEAVRKAEERVAERAAAKAAKGKRQPRSQTNAPRPLGDQR